VIPIASSAPFWIELADAVSHPPLSTEAWTVPELGPSLGRLADPPSLPSNPSSSSLPLEDLRLNLVSGIFDMAGAARSFMAAGDRQGAISSLGRVAWLDRWEKAVAGAAQRLADAVNDRLRAAATESRLPERRLLPLLLRPEDVRAIASRLGSGGAGFVAALDALEQTVPAAAASGARGRLGQEEWQVALASAARRLESAWLALLENTRQEQFRWNRDIERVRSWRRPTWPLWLLTSFVLLALGYLGLVLGGYLPVPEPLQGMAEFVWSRL
jgi:hypothetical protein